MAILRQLTWNRHNSRVPDFVPDSPAFEAAEQKFSGFLRSQNYPQKICWLMPGDVVVDNERHYWVRDRKANAAFRYAEGIHQNLGILLVAVCSTETETFASVLVPDDDVEAQYHLMGRGLKLSCPVEKYPTTATTNPLHWLLLRLRYGNQSKMLEVNQGPSQP